MSDVNDYYFSKLLLFQTVVKDCQKQSISLSSFINKVEDLLDILEQFDLVEWSEKVRALWLELEIKYAVMLNENRLEFSKEEQKEIEKIVNEIYYYVEEQIEKIPEDYWYKSYSSTM